jgi:hypothetical protein
MIKNLAFISFLSLFILQNIEAQKFKGGLNLGLIASQVDGDFRGNYNKPGLFTGAYILFPFKHETMGLQLELDYAQKGSKSQGKNSDGTLNKSRMALHQIEIPVLFNYNIIRKLTLSGGLSCNMLVSTKIYDSYGYTSELYADPYKFKFFELGLLLGGSYLFKKHYGLSFRYGYSLTPIGTSLDARRRWVSGLRNNFLQFHFSYQF